MRLICIKIVGYAALILGFVALCLPAVPQGGIFKAMAIQQLHAMPQYRTNSMAFQLWEGRPIQQVQQETYSRADLLDAMQKVAGESWNATNSPPVGGALIMLFGGILIDVGSRLKKPKPN